MQNNEVPHIYKALKNLNMSNDTFTKPWVLPALPHVDLCGAKIFQENLLDSKLRIINMHDKICVTLF